MTDTEPEINLTTSQVMIKNYPLITSTFEYINQYYLKAQFAFEVLAPFSSGQRRDLEIY